MDKADGGVDLVREFVDLYDREEMLAFFEFRLEKPGGAEIEGICRISRPKDGRSNLSYLSLGFVADAPDEETRSWLDEKLGRIDGDTLRAAVPFVAEVLPMNVMATSPESYIRQADILFGEETPEDSRAILSMLVPAVAAIADFHARELVWWTSS